MSITNTLQSMINRNNQSFFNGGENIHARRAKYQKAYQFKAMIPCHDIDMDFYVKHVSIEVFHEEADSLLELYLVIGTNSLRVKLEDVINNGTRDLELGLLDVLGWENKFMEVCENSKYSYEDIDEWVVREIVSKMEIVGKPIFTRD